LIEENRKTPYEISEDLGEIEQGLEADPRPVCSPFKASRSEIGKSDSQGAQEAKRRSTTYLKLTPTGDWS